MSKNQITDFFIKLRNITCFIFTWMCILIMAGGMFLNKTNISVTTLVKIFIFCLITSALLVTAFSENILHKKSFIFRLTVFFVSFVPVEILFFYWIRLFEGSGNIKLWGIFLLILVVFYLASVIIDKTIYAKKGLEYTKKLEAYKRG